MKKKTHYFPRRLARPCQPISQKKKKFSKKYLKTKKIFFFFFLPIFFFFLSSPFILQHKHLSSLKQPSKTSITIKPSYLPQIFTKSQNFFTQTIPYITPNIIHQSKTTFIHPNHNSPKVLYPINLIQTPQILHQRTPLNSQSSLKHQPHN